MRLRVEHDDGLLVLNTADITGLAIDIKRYEGGAVKYIVYIDTGHIYDLLYSTEGEALGLIKRLEEYV